MVQPPTPPQSLAGPAQGWLARLRDSDLWFSFRSSLAAQIAALVAVLCLVCALFAPWLAPTNPFDLAHVDLMDARLPPAWLPGGQQAFWLGSDDQGRDMVSLLLYGSRISLVVGLVSVALSLLVGVALGLLAGYAGGVVDAVLMRACDVILSFPAILVALLVDGVGRALFPQAHEDMAYGVLILAIALSAWVPYARTVRGGALVERHKEYVQAARLLGVRGWRIAMRHVLPNVLGPVTVIATIQVAVAIQLEAALSYLGVGMPATSPSLGTLIRTGQSYLFSGEWWMALFPGLMLAAIAVSVNLLGDWLRDALNPRLN